MKFITEDELRYLYKKEPFTSYELEPGAKLTPGAREFLADKLNLQFYDEKEQKKPAPAEMMKEFSDCQPCAKGEELVMLYKFLCMLDEMKAMVLEMYQAVGGKECQIKK